MASGGWPEGQKGGTAANLEVHLHSGGEATEPFDVGVSQCVLVYVGIGWQLFLEIYGTLGAGLSRS